MEREQSIPESLSPAPQDLDIESRSNLGEFPRTEYSPPLLSESPLSASQLFSHPELQARDMKKVRRDLWETTGSVLPIIGGAPDKDAYPINYFTRREYQNKPLTNQELQRLRALWEEDFRKTKTSIWDEDFENLSENGQRLFSILLGQVGWTQYLSRIALLADIDLDAGLDELRKHGILDENDPNIFLLKLKGQY